MDAPQGSFRIKRPRRFHLQILRRRASGVRSLWPHLPEGNYGGKIEAGPEGGFALPGDAIDNGQTQIAGDRCIAPIVAPPVGSTTSPVQYLSRISLVGKGKIVADGRANEIRKPHKWG